MRRDREQAAAGLEIVLFIILVLSLLFIAWSAF